MTPEVKRLMKADARATATDAYASYLLDMVESLESESDYDPDVLYLLRLDHKRAVKRADAAYQALVWLMDHSAVHYALGYRPNYPYLVVADLAPYTRYMHEHAV